MIFYRKLIQGLIQFNFYFYLWLIFIMKRKITKYQQLQYHHLCKQVSYLFVYNQAQ